MGRPFIPLKEKLFRRITKNPNGCWEVLSNVHPVTGYAVIGHWENGEKVSRLAHRVSYEIHKGVIPQGLIIDHLCRNRKCVNPEHLEAVTQRENLMRGDCIASNNAKKTHCLRGHEFSIDNTYHPPKFPSKRYCKKCQELRDKQLVAGGVSSQR